MFLDSIRSLFSGAAAEPVSSTASDGPDPIHVAACALLLEIAHADGEFSDAERRHLERSLEVRFRLSPSEVAAVSELAERERSASIDHFRFTTRLRDRLSHDEKIGLAESMWGLVLADGLVAEHEHYLARKIANLLDLDPGSLSAAKAAAEGSASE